MVLGPPALAAASPSASPSPVDITLFGGRADGVAEDGPALQAAIDAVVQEARKRSDTLASAAVRLPNGRYRISQTIVLPIWVKLLAEGSVLLDFRGLQHGSAALRISGGEVPGSYKSAANTGHVLNGTSGGITVVGPGLGTGTVGIDYGNEACGEAPYDARDGSIAGVVVSYFSVALRFRASCTYLFAASHCRFETNDLLVQAGFGEGANGGEMIRFDSCVFADSRVGVRFEKVAFDLVFRACSFDFIEGHCVEFAPGSEYNSARFVACYFEAAGEQALIRSHARSNVATLSDCAALPRTIERAAGGGHRPAAPRRLFRGRLTLSVAGLELRHEAGNPAPESLFLCDPEVDVWASVTIFKHGHYQVMSERQILNQGGLRSAAACASDSGWTVTTARGARLLHDRERFDGRCVLRLRAAVETSRIEMLSESFPVMAGDRLSFAAPFQAGRATGTIEARLALLLLSPGGQILSRHGASARIGALYDDPARTPHDAGRDYWLRPPENHNLVPVPPGCSLARLSLEVTAMAGELRVGEPIVWRI